MARRRKGLPASCSDSPHAVAQLANRALSLSNLVIYLASRLSISVPLAWFRRFLRATSKERFSWEIAGAYYRDCWQDIDDEISEEGLLLGGAPAPQTKDTGQLTTPYT